VYVLFYEEKGFCPGRGRDIGHLIPSAITMGKAYLATPAGLAPEGEKSWGWRIPSGGHEKQGRGVKIGWVKDDEILLQPDAAYSDAYKLEQDQGEILPGSPA
jgi:hypothetical protein